MKKQIHQQKILERYYNESEKYKKKLKSLNLKLILTLVKQVKIHKTDFNVILKNISTVLNKTKVDNRFKKKYQNLVRYLLSKVKFHFKGIIVAPALIMETFLFILEKENFFNKTLKLINEQVRSELGIAKNDFLDRDIFSSIADNKIFALVSFHNDCAKDHKNYQGKIYLLTSVLTTEEREESVRLNATTMFSNVIKNTPYLITRPNCRHYYLPLALEDVKNKNVQDLLKEHNMVHNVGIREQIQTKKGNIDYYKERLAYHLMLYRETHSPLMKKVIIKDKLLITNKN